MKAGMLRHLVTIENPNYVLNTDTGEEELQGWTTLAQVYASIEPISGREQLAAAQVIGSTTVRIRIRYLAGITASSRVTFSDKIYTLTAPPIDRMERHKELELLCSEGITEE